MKYHLELDPNPVVPITVFTLEGASRLEIIERLEAGYPGAAQYIAKLVEVEPWTERRRRPRVTC